MASDSEIQAKEILRIKKRMNDLYVKYTGKSLKEIEKAMDRDTFLEADEAKEFGLVDQVFDRRPGLPGDDAPKDVSEGPTPCFLREFSSRRHPGLDPGSLPAPLSWMPDRKSEERQGGKGGV